MNHAVDAVVALGRWLSSAHSCPHATFSVIKTSNFPGTGNQLISKRAPRSRTLELCWTPLMRVRPKRWHAWYLHESNSLAALQQMSDCQRDRSFMQHTTEHEHHVHASQSIEPTRPAAMCCAMQSPSPFSWWRSLYDNASDLGRVLLI